MIKNNLVPVTVTERNVYMHYYLILPYYFISFEAVTG